MGMSMKSAAANQFEWHFTVGYLVRYIESETELELKMTKLDV